MSAVYRGKACMNAHDEGVPEVVRYRDCNVAPGSLRKVGDTIIQTATNAHH